METNKIYQGDCLSVLKTFLDESINCVMTSPPYFGLRNYGVDGQLGLEPTFQEYITKLCAIFDEVKRVLREDGTCWVNIGDTYSGNLQGAGGTYELSKIQNSNRGSHFAKDNGEKSKVITNLPDKCSCQIPSRFAIAMTDRGWILRNTIIWYKRNCMPSSVTDRFTVDFEYLFFFVKNKKYWFEQQRQGDSHYVTIAKVGQKRFGGNTAIGVDTIRGDRVIETIGRNMRCVWDITTKAYRADHFAVYPEELCMTPIKAGCPVDGIVLDPFSGAGTTALVAKKLGRRYVGIELNPKYVEMSEKRIHNNMGLL